jgi:hypothetical protein
LQHRCGEVDTAFLRSLRQKAAARSPHPRLRIRTLRGKIFAVFVGELK